MSRQAKAIESIARARRSRSAGTNTDHMPMLKNVTPVSHPMRRSTGSVRFEGSAA